MPILDIVEQGKVTTTCRDRLRQLLTTVDEDGSIDEADLLSLIGSTSCSQGHNLHVRVLTRGMLQKTNGSSLRLGRDGEDWLIEHGRPPREWAAGGPASAPVLRAWQGAALDAWAAHGRFGVVEAVTGTGKSRVGVEAIREALDDDYDVVVVVPTTALVDQWERTLRNGGISGVATMAAGTRSTWMRHRVIVGTVQSLYTAPPVRDDGKVLIVADECHRYGAPEWSKALHSSYRRRLGLTATFERNDEGLAALMQYFGGGPVYQIGFAEAIRTDVVARYDVKLMGVDLTAKERERYDDADDRAKEARNQLLAADFPAEPFGAFMTAVQQSAEGDPDPTIEDVARRFLKAFSERVDVMAGAVNKLDAMRALAPAVGASRGALVFTRRKESAEDLAAVLRDEHVAAYPIHSGHTMHQRRERLAGLKTGRAQALVAPTVLDEGVDVPDVDLGVVMSGSKSRRQMIQRMGRVLRRKADGRKATFVVVYARDTAEDLSGSDGQEGALDLIVESADRVFDLQWDGEDLIEHPVRTSPAVEGADPPPATPTAIDNSGVVQVAADVVEKQNEPQLPEALRAVDPSRLPMTRQALKQFQKVHGGSDEDADAVLRQLLGELLGSRRIYPRSTPYNSYSLRGETAEIVITPDRFVGYRMYAEELTRDNVTPRPVAPSGPEPILELSGEEVDLLDHLVPATIQFSGEALEMICDVFELGDLRMSDALREARSLLTLDLGTGPNIEETDMGYAVRCLLATWNVDDEIAQVIGVEGRLSDLGTADSVAMPADEKPSEEARVDEPKDVTSVERPTPAVGDASDLPEPEAVEPVSPRDSSLPTAPEPDLVDRLERLASLHQSGLLMDEEFKAAKAKLLF